MAKIIRSDLKTIQKISQRIDHTVTEADFDTYRPNPRRVDSIASDIHRYLNVEVKLNGFKC